MINLHIFYVLFFSLLFFLGSCKEKAAADNTDADKPVTITPVTITSVGNGQLSEFIELNAVSAFLQKSYVKANANGYLQAVDTYLGKSVQNGQLLFTMKTKEAQSIGNSISVLDSTFKFSGLISIKANAHGYITQLNHQAGDYVQDGEQLAVISDRNSFVFLLDLPYELRPYITDRKSVELILPDGKKIQGTISSAMPAVDAASQTQSVIIRIAADQTIPENLIAKVRVQKTAKGSAQSLPKTAVLANETQTDFWVMKMMDSTTAVKVAVKKGIETGDRVEITYPVFSGNDKILVSGNYGLPDTAKVKIVD